MFKKVTHTYVILFSFIEIAAIDTWFVAGGEYVEETILVNGVDKTEMVFRYIPLIILLVVVGFLFLMPTVTMELNGF